MNKKYYNKEKWRVYKKTQESKLDYKIKKAEWQKRYRQKHKEKIKKYRKEYDLLNKDKTIVWNLVNKKHKTEMKNMNCYDCKTKKAEHKHHEDYNKPLEVVFLCRSCHKKRHNIN